MFLIRWSWKWTVPAHAGYWDMGLLFQDFVNLQHLNDLGSHCLLPPVSPQAIHFVNRWYKLTINKYDTGL